MTRNEAYQALDLDPNSLQPLETIRKQFKKLSLIYHPDKIEQRKEQLEDDLRENTTLNEVQRAQKQAEIDSVIQQLTERYERIRDAYVFFQNNVDSQTSFLKEDAMKIWTTILPSNF